MSCIRAIRHCCNCSAVSLARHRTSTSLVLAVCNTTQVLSSLNSVALTLVRNDEFSFSNDTTLALRVCSSSLVSLILHRGISNRWTIRLLGTDDKIIDVDAAAGQEVVGCLLSGNGPNGVDEVLDNDDDDDDDTGRDLLQDGPKSGTNGATDKDTDKDAESYGECDRYGVDIGVVLYQAMLALYPNGKRG
ncbi:hypothetical protein Tco_0167430 [Tanacetum coccineum]